MIGENSVDSDKAPYFIVLAISAFAWAVSHFYETIVTSPIVEFDVVTEDLGGTASTKPALKRITLELRNVTDEQAFPSILVWLRPSDGNADRLTITPTASQYSDPTNIWSQKFKSSARVNIKDAQPHETYIAIVEYPPDVRVAIAFDSGSVPIRFMERGLVTTAIRWSQEVMVYTVLAFPGFILLWLMYLGYRTWDRRRTARLTAFPILDAGGGA